MSFNRILLLSYLGFKKVYLKFEGNSPEFGKTA